MVPMVIYKLNYFVLCVISLVLQTTKSDLHETMVNLEVNEALSANLERATQDKVALEQRLKSTMEKEGSYSCTMYSQRKCLARILI